MTTVALGCSVTKLTADAAIKLGWDGWSAADYGSTMADWTDPAADLWKFLAQGGDEKATTSTRAANLARPVTAAWLQFCSHEPYNRQEDDARAVLAILQSKLPGVPIYLSGLPSYGPEIKKADTIGTNAAARTLAALELPIVFLGPDMSAITLHTDEVIKGNTPHPNGKGRVIVGAALAAFDFGMSATNADMTVTVYQAKDGWRWHLQAKNGRIVAESGESYENKQWAVHVATGLHPDAALHLEDRNGMTEESDE